VGHFEQSHNSRCFQVFHLAAFKSSISGASFTVTPIHAHWTTILPIHRRINLHPVEIQAMTLFSTSPTKLVRIIDRACYVGFDVFTSMTAIIGSVFEMVVRSNFSFTRFHFEKTLDFISNSSKKKRSILFQTLPKRNAVFYLKTIKKTQPRNQLKLKVMQGMDGEGLKSAGVFLNARGVKIVRA
jgi:hypothetical protein